MLRSMLRLGATFAASALLCLSTAVAEEGKPAAKGEGRPGVSADRKAEFLKKFDKNGDGKLDDAEREAAKAEMIKNRPQGGKEGGPRGAEFMKKFDKNGDGKLDEAERAAAKAEFQKNRPAGDKPARKPEGDAPAKKPESPKAPEKTK